MQEKFPPWYRLLRSNYGKFMESLEQLGEAARAGRPPGRETSQLIQLAAAAAVRSEGSVHSHVRRARAAGATPEEIYHALILLTSTIGFPTMSVASSWAYDILEKEPG